MAVKHTKVSSIADSGDITLVRPSDWNANHNIEAGTITDVEVATANKDGIAGIASMRTLGTGSQQACGGADGRLSDSRTPTAHKDSHKSGGSDALASTDIIEAIGKRLQESGTPTTLTMGAIADGEFLKRSASTIVGVGYPGDSYITILPDHPSSITQGSWAFATNASSTNNGYWYNPSASNLDRVNYTGINFAPGTWTFDLICYTDSVRGILDVLIDGVSVGTIDLYSASPTYNVQKTITGISISTTGIKTLGLKVNGKNASSTNYYMGLVSIVMWRTA